MPRLRLRIEFDGTHFHGWQLQASERTVQGELTAAVQRMVKHPVVLRASSRTDAGVHAKAMPVVFDTPLQIRSRGWVLGLNSLLPPDLSVVDAQEVSDDFDPRRHSLRKTYRYQIWNREGRSALLGRTSWHVPMALDLDAMRRAAQLVLGEQDFRAFRSAHCDSLSTHRRMDAVVLYCPSDSPGLLQIDVTANAFLRNMARILVGTLIDVGTGHRTLEQVQAALLTGERTFAGQTAPPQGLFLMEVGYP